VHRAKLLTSELVTNAVLHGRGRIMLSARLEEQRLLVEVADEGSGFDYVAGQRSVDHLRGRGLAIVAAESARWGIDDGTAQVWFELAVTIPAGTGSR
jgi:anti-sigma regulatory factor (Ser/Thr protein kinase)